MRPALRHRLGFARSLLCGLGAASFVGARVAGPGGPLELSLPCPLRALTGLPCLSCGATHALGFLSRGRALSALHANPLFALGACALWTLTALWVLQAPSGRPPWPALSEPWVERNLSGRARWLLPLGLLANWLWVWHSGGA